MQVANWDLFKKQREVDASQYESKQEAEAKKASSEANFFAQQQAADTELYRKKKEAEGICAVAQAKGLYLNTLLKELRGNYAAVRDYLMISKNVFQEVAKIKA